jgi:hypothetical protein
MAAGLVERRLAHAETRAAIVTAALSIFIKLA